MLVLVFGNVAALRLQFGDHHFRGSVTRPVRLADFPWRRGRNEGTRSFGHRFIYQAPATGRQEVLRGFHQPPAAGVCALIFKGSLEADRHRHANGLSRDRLASCNPVRRRPGRQRRDRYLSDPQYLRRPFRPG